ncbi:MAG: translation elongation factor Ts [Firmicutes bacterium]|nr:translation elongation factor Ts [Bacillota bacterium]
MAEITVERIRALRERTGAGMMDVKRALEQAGGDEEEAIRILREKGLAQAAKRATRAALEGLVAVHVDPVTGRAALVEVNCETDFVARTADFRALVDLLARHAARWGEDPAEAGGQPHRDPRGEASLERVEALLAQPVEGEGKPARDVLMETAARLGERVRLRRYAVFAASGLVESYVHGDGRIGVLLEAVVQPSEGAARPELRQVLRDLAMQGAAYRAEYVERTQVPEAVRERERQIYRSAALNEGKPEKVVDRIVEGRLDKFYQEVCLLEQPFIRDPNVQVGRHVRPALEPLGVQLEVRRFARFERAEQLAGDTQEA